MLKRRNKNFSNKLISLLLLAPTVFANSGVINPTNGHSYARFDTVMSWQEAKGFCVGKGGYLATITSQDEQEFVYNKLGRYSPNNGSWLGGSDELHEGDWKWLTGEPWGYTHWNCGEPNNSGNEDSLGMWSRNIPFAEEVGFWNDFAAAGWGMSTICEASGTQFAFSTRSPVAKTGQTFSTLVGDDGSLQKGVAWPKPRFVALVNKLEDKGTGGGKAGNGWCDGAETCNGAVKDRLTDLIWLANAACFGRQEWADAVLLANALASGRCGLSDGSKAGDWRLPNIKELLSLIDYQCLSPALSDRLGTSCFRADAKPVFSFPGVVLWEYWSSDTAAIYSGYALTLELGGGGTGVDVKGARVIDHFVWPVRGGQ